MNNTVPAYILGQAQRSFRDVDAVDDPQQLMIEIARWALDDAGISAERVEAIGCVDPLSWTYADLAHRVAAGVGCRDDIREFWVPGGGTTPQDLLHEIATAMAEAELDVAVLVGAEAMRTRRKATRAGRELPWPPRDKSVKPMRGQKPFTSEWEAKHGLRLPIQCFPMLENALRHAHQRGGQEQIDLAAQILHKNALVAAGNESAWFQDAPEADDISTVSTENRMISYPYTKRMNAIMDVDQSAALVVVSDRFLQQQGGRNRAAAVLGGAAAEEVWNPMQRRTLSECAAMGVAFADALASAGVALDEIDAFDFYSCFPSPIQLALDALDMSVQDPRPFSITGGLAYGGGPGNNYGMHSLSTAVQMLRDHPEQRLLITGVGMANTKHAATVLANADHVPEKASGVTKYRIDTGEKELPVAEKAQGPASIVTYTIEYDRAGAPANVIYILDTANGRAVANAPEPRAAARVLLQSDPIGLEGELVWDEQADRQFFTIK